MIDNRKAIVASGYDLVAQRYREWSGGAQVREHFLERFCDLLPPKGYVLDLGCGCGVPVAKRLSRQASVVGVDISGTQISLARQEVPEATFIQADMMAADFPAETFDGISAFFALTHLPREEHLEMLSRIARWLRPGGIFVASLGAGATDDAIEDNWLGVPMFFSHFDAETNKRLVQQAGLEVVHEEIVEHVEDDTPIRFLWVIAKKSG